MKTGSDGIVVMHAFEGCRFAAYPGPATGGKPWTIGWATPGPTTCPAWSSLSSRPTTASPAASPPSSIPW